MNTLLTWRTLSISVLYALMFCCFGYIVYVALTKTMILMTELTSFDPRFLTIAKAVAGMFFKCIYTLGAAFLLGRSIHVIKVFAPSTVR